MGNVQSSVVKVCLSARDSINSLNVSNSALPVFSNSTVEATSRLSDSLQTFISAIRESSGISDLSKTSFDTGVSLIDDENKVVRIGKRPLGVVLDMYFLF